MQVTSRDIFLRKSSCGDLQSRLKVRKVLGVGDTAGSKISQILGHSDHLIFQLPPKLATWLLLTTTLFCCFTVMGLLWPSCLRFILLGNFESTLHLATSYAFLATILGLTLRSGDKISLQLVLFSLTLFHSLSFCISLWFLKTSDTKIKSMISLIFHLFCLLINAHFYLTIIRSVSLFRLYYKPKAFFSSILSFPSTPENIGHDSS
ncbi:unnamed protein product [Rotaria sordida]|uniref:Tumor protein p53-inducible protein 11 n=1 Tax=Rotaria sordida TaxID=392033 RepID=A0A814H5A4_9BILA|nr:unnamed protein product [Rotaria sordida]CAF0880776.1 unnamed protein product [Rotaria sordida]CAF0900389.1 unnamed protein product [Rotaria sordida]CAF0960887.1 unnamed protein product [Rotaria sordida]CAF0963430.1 unnamed protein product [Rotaria sordida]